MYKYCLEHKKFFTQDCEWCVESRETTHYIQAEDSIPFLLADILKEIQNLRSDLHRLDVGLEKRCTSGKLVDNRYTKKEKPGFSSISCP